MTTATDTKTETKVKLKPISMWKVILHNDDYTPMDFVTAVLMRFFGKNYDEANAVMLAIHQQGRGVAGLYTQEIAQQKAKETMMVAKQNGHPLMVTAEEA